MILKVGKQEYEEVVDILTSAFYDDPVYVWFMRQDHQKEEAYRHFFNTVLSEYFIKSIVYKDSESRATSVWIDSKYIPDYTGRDRPTTDSFLKNISYWCTEKGVNKFIQLTDLQDKTHPKERHHYLWVVGVIPEAQGRGLGTEILRHHLAVLDEIQMPTYLENSNEKNLGLYKRLGFQQVNTIEIEKDGPHFWGMWRESQ
jgi:ribosomal protein S18 acetylase RimI-like enzyme